MSKGMLKAMYNLSKSLERMAKINCGTQQEQNKAINDTNKAVKRAVKKSFKNSSR